MIQALLIASAFCLEFLFNLFVALSAFVLLREEEALRRFRLFAFVILGITILGIATEVATGLLLELSVELRITLAKLVRASTQSLAFLLLSTAKLSSIRNALIAGLWTSLLGLALGLLALYTYPLEA